MEVVVVDEEADEETGLHPRQTQTPPPPSPPRPTRRSHRPPPSPTWPTVDGPLGPVTEEESASRARAFFRYGFLCLPWLWAINAFYFWPVLKSSSSSFPRVRPYVVGSAVGFVVFTAVLLLWALTFAIGGEHLFGHFWGDLLMYNVADKLGLTGFI
ncbi:putative gamma-secretase subunit PEN-2 [Acorus calamus]|uniref:Gamma-secretase subunit PEN-2 n=1 Tax=Acorus calamus TaxID=4465 RepID=A0AAV9DF05_ACOCL|nr:putative gamma-secretase subunit PEN-2 [Acorus calamus]